tara:strand:+ start:63 stop:326 length:264 start_codon:yes stop_codon:yes gene_type:complete
MKVMIKERCMSTSAGLLRQGDVADLPDEEIKKVMKLKPNAFEILPAEPVFKSTKKKAPAKKKRARNKDGTLKGNDPSTPENEAWEDA